jgi:GT2 family glycosyltransferase
MVKKKSPLLISVVIATINRQDELREALNAYRKQSYPHVEIVIIDNGSTDGTREMMEEEFSDVIYQWLPYNMGTHAINIGLEVSHGDIIWFSNNDSYPESTEAFQEIVDIYEQHSHVDIIGSEDVEMRDGGKIFHWHPEEVDKGNVPPDGYPTIMFHGTGAATRRTVIDKIGGFWDTFTYEEIDFCTRAIKEGFNVRYFPNIRTLHFASPRSRNQSNRWLLTCHTLIRYYWRHFPTSSALVRTLANIPFHMAIGVFHRFSPLILFEGLLQMILTMFSTARKERNPFAKKDESTFTLGKSPWAPMIGYFKERKRLRGQKQKKHK